VIWALDWWIGTKNENAGAMSLQSEQLKQRTMSFALTSRTNLAAPTGLLPSHAEAAELRAIFSKSLGQPVPISKSPDQMPQ
jgi:hypothetical protein